MPNYDFDSGTNKTNEQNNNYVTPNPDGNPVGIGDVVRMEYEVGLGTFDNGLETKLAWTDSFKQGVSLSEIRWGFVNTAIQKGNETTGKISFTLHDISGNFFDTYMDLKTGTRYIYFKGPTSAGPIWQGEYSLYQVDPQNCSLEFSPTQGFTYTIAGISAATITRSSVISAPYDFAITNTQNGTNKTFKQIIENELTKMWNKKLDEAKKSTARIKIIMDPEKDANATYMNTLPINNDTKYKGDSGGTFQFAIKQGQTIYDVITSLWHEKFETVTHKNNDVRCRVDFKKWEGSEITVEVFFTDKTIKKSFINLVKICVGDDVNCSSKDVYRAELASINLNDFINRYISRIFNVKTENDGAIPASGAMEQKIANNYQEDENVPYKSYGFFRTQENNRMSPYWTKVQNLLQKNITTGLEIELNMPYTSDMAPDICGGILKSGLNGKSATIHYSQGADFKFYWYTDPSCEKLALSIISGIYRISEVTHQIGLSGNQTIVKLTDASLI